MDADARRGEPELKTAYEVSAGGLVVRGGEVLLISTQQGRRWQLPKGHIEEGESRQQAAEREVSEETGVLGNVVATLPDIEYWYIERGTQRIHKRVYYFLLTYERGSETDFDPEEVSGAAWMPWDVALASLTFSSERDVLRTAREKVLEGAAGPEAASLAGAGLGPAHALGEAPG